MEFLYFAALLFGYVMGIFTILSHQWLERRSLRIQEELEHETDYTLTVLRQPRDLSESEE